MKLLDWWRERRRDHRAYREARALMREARRILRKYDHRLTEAVRTEARAAVQEVADALGRRDAEALRVGLGRLDEVMESHLAFGRKSTLREYAESIGVAVLIALLLRAFVVEAFKIPSGSMIPTLKVGDHIFVSKYLYGLRIPFTHLKFFEYRKPKRGEVVVFMAPREPDKDFIKRVVAIEGDTVEFHDGRLFINGAPVPRRPLFDPPCSYSDIDELSGRLEHKDCDAYIETLDGSSYLTVYDKLRMSQPQDPLHIPPGQVFVMGDNRDNSNDSRYWGTVPLDHIKGKALFVWWSSGGDDGVRWGRLFRVVR